MQQLLPLHRITHTVRFLWVCSIVVDQKLHTLLASCLCCMMESCSPALQVESNTGPIYIIKIYCCHTCILVYGISFSHCFVAKMLYHTYPNICNSNIYHLTNSLYLATDWGHHSVRKHYYSTWHCTWYLARSRL